LGYLQLQISARPERPKILSTKEPTMKRLALALLASAAWASAAYGQTTPTVTRSYTYEWIHVRITLREPENDPFNGLLFMEDVSGAQGAQSRFLGYLRGEVNRRSPRAKEIL
jgi:hypothetical protein